MSKLSNLKPTGRYTSRKFWTMVVAQTAWIVLLLMEGVGEEIFYDLTKITLGLFFISNAVQKFSKGSKDATSNER